MKINQVLVESAGATVAFAFGRFNPAHQGHIEVWRTVEQAGANWFIGTNSSTLGPNDPLTFQQKSAWMEEIYPPISGHIVAEQSVLTLAAYIFKKTRKNESATVAYITDASDWAWSGKLLNQYNGVEGAHGYYKFAQIIHVPSPRVSSATALRDAARADDRVAFYHASGTDPKSKVAGLTYFDTVKQACEKYPLPVKKVKKVKEQGVAEGSVTPDVTVNKVHDDGHEKEWHIYRGKEMIGYVTKNQPETAEGLYIAYGHGPGRAFVEEFTGLKPAVNYIASLKEGVVEDSLGLKKLHDALWTVISEQTIDEETLNEIDPGMIANLYSVFPTVAKIIVSNALNKARKEAKETSLMINVMKKHASSQPVTPQENEAMLTQFKDIVSYGLSAVAGVLTGAVAGPAAGAGVALAGAYKKELLALLQTKGPEVLIGLLKSKGKLDVVDILSAKLLGKHALPFYAAPKMAEGYYDRGDYYNAHKAGEYGRGYSHVTSTGGNSRSDRDDILKGQSDNLPADPFKRTTGQVPKSKQGRVHHIARPEEMDEDNQKTVAKTWDQMTPQEKSSGVKGRTVWNEKTKRYYTVFDVPTKQTTDEASLATMRDYFAGDENARDPYDITKQRLHFAKDKNAKPTVDKRFRSPEEYQAWLKQNKLKQVSGVQEDEEAGEVKQQGQLIPFPAGTTKVHVSDVYDWYKLGMVISDLDDADPKMFGQGAPQTVIAFGSEEEESKLLPLLKRLGLRVDDIDPEGADLDEAYHAGELYEYLKKVHGKWALVSKSNPKKVLQYYRGGDEKPSDEWVNKVERRVHSFESKKK